MVAWRHFRRLGRARSRFPLWRALRNLCAILSLLAGSAISAVPYSVAADLSQPSEYELKAAFLYNFIKFTEWPAGEMGKPDDPFVIAVVGKDPFGRVLDRTVEGERVHERAIVVRRYPKMDAAAADSHVLFIGASEAKSLPAILKQLEGDAVLTVSDMSDFAGAGGMIYLKKDNNRIAFEINLSAAKKVKLSLNAQLLKLATIVKTGS